MSATHSAVWSLRSCRAENSDPVCDADPDADTDALSPAALAIHTSYAPTTSGPHAWGIPLYQLVANAAPTAGSDELSSPAEGLATPVR